MMKNYLNKNWKVILTMAIIWAVGITLIGLIKNSMWHFPLLALFASTWGIALVNETNTVTKNYDEKKQGNKFKITGEIIYDENGNLTETNIKSKFDMLDNCDKDKFFSDIVSEIDNSFKYKQ